MIYSTFGVKHEAVYLMQLQLNYSLLKKFHINHG